MKKFIYLFSAMLAGLAFSSVASAQAVNEIGSLNAGGAILTTECTVLSTKTNVTLSTNSLLTYKCSPVYNQVKLMTCNTAGSRSPATVNCKFTADATGTVEFPAGSGVMGEFNDSSCTAEVDADGNPYQFDIAGGRYFTMSSAGGGIATSGGAATDTCSTTAMEGQI